MIFVKNPELGKAKTRLAATIGDEKALQIYKKLLTRTKEVTEAVGVDLEVHYNQFIDQNDLWDNERYHKELQISGELGEKMEHAFQKAFDKGYERVAIIGSDCYDLNTDILKNAFDQLSKHDFVIGPSFDGGYYLLGMRQFSPQLFANKQWSTETVFRDTQADIRMSGLSLHLLQTLSDIDTEQDLGEWAVETLRS